jgi:hypothetical protein
VARLLARAGIHYAHGVSLGSGGGTPAHAAAGSDGPTTPARALSVSVPSGGPGGVPSSPRLPPAAVDSSGADAGAAAGIDSEIDVFISYRRKTGAVLAQLLNMHFKAAGLRVFLDVENLGTGAFDVALQRQLTAARNVVVILSEGALDRCIADAAGKDFVRKEIAMSFRMGKNVVPVKTDEFVYPEEAALPEDIRAIATSNAVPWSHMYQAASVGKILSFLHR